MDLKTEIVASSKVTRRKGGATISGHVKGYYNGSELKLLSCMLQQTVASFVRATGGVKRS